MEKTTNGGWTFLTNHAHVLLPLVECGRNRGQTKRITAHGVAPFRYPQIGRTGGGSKGRKAGILQAEPGQDS